MLAIGQQVITRSFVPILGLADFWQCLDFESSRHTGSHSQVKVGLMMQKVLNWRSSGGYTPLHIAAINQASQVMI